MPQMVAALFKTRAKAEEALQALIGSGVARDRITVIGEDAGREVSSISGFRDLSRDDDLAALQDLALPEEDGRSFEAGLRRGGALVAARIDRDHLEQAINVLEMFDPVDLDQRSEAWQQDHHDSENARSGIDVGGPLASGLTAGARAGQTNTSAVPGMGTMTDSTHDVGSADLRTDEASLSDMGQSSTTATGDRRAEERAGRPGVLEMGRGMRRDTNRSGRVRTYTRD
jgi:hypothetical protein